MTRKKVKLVWIVNDSARKASLKKRRLGLLKKVSELITLCGVEAFIIVYSPDEAEPVIWPPTRADVERLIMRYTAMPEMERCKKLTNQETYLKERMGKVHDQSKKSHKKNKDSELGYLMFQVHRGKGLDQFETVELHGLAWLVEDRMKDLRKRIEYFQMVSPLDQRRAGSEDVEVGGGESGVLPGKMIQNPNEPMSWDQWFLDMVHNTEGNVGGGPSNISTRGGSEIGYQYPPHGFGPYGSVDMGYDRFPGNVGPSGMMLYPPPPEFEGHEYAQFCRADMGGGNPFGMNLAPPPPLPPPYHGGDGSGGTSMGMHGFFGGDAGGSVGPSGPSVDGNGMGLSNYDVSNPHWLNYS